MTTDAPVETFALDRSRGEALLAFFERVDCRCYCRYLHFEGDKNAWLDRCFNATSDSRRELAERIAAEDDEARGIVATTDGGRRVVGWLKVAPVRAVAKAYEQRFYRGLPCFGGDRRGVFLIGCALVDPAFRKTGVATAMVARAVDLAPSWGAVALEAFPRRPREPVSDEELWTVPDGAFRGLGFDVVSATDPYPVLRRTL